MTRSRSTLPPLQGLLVLLTGEGLARLVSFVAVWLLTQRLGRLWKVAA